MDGLVVRESRLGGEWLFTLTNMTGGCVTPGEVCVKAWRHGYAPDCRIYGEGFQMLSQYEGTVSQPRCLTPYSDAGHYRLPQRAGYHTVYNLWMVETAPLRYDAAAFTSCRRFSGKIEWDDQVVRLVLDLERVSLRPGETLELERACFCSGMGREEALAEIGGYLRQNHPLPALPDETPRGWCSWYCFGPEVTETDILGNLEVMRRELLAFRFVQIDDGYEAAMGDWLQPRPGFGDLDGLLRAVRERGGEPAIWVAPFIAEASSALLRDHPEYFVQDEAGCPLASDRFTFGGWRNGPWYMLDGTHPGARNYLTHVFRVMREEWHIRYFKLDANCWGAFSRGRRYDPGATAVEAYRAGMDAVWKGAGRDAIVLGCNAPMWPSIGAVNAMRITGDAHRDWATVKSLQRELFHRTWMHRTLWLNDPDVLTLRSQSGDQLLVDGSVAVIADGALTPEEIRFHKTCLFASGGLLLSGDDLQAYTRRELEQLRRFRTFSRGAAFADLSLSVGWMEEDGSRLICLFNDEDAPRCVSVELGEDCMVRDVWDEEAAFACGPVLSVCLPPHDARLYRLLPTRDGKKD